MSTALAIPPKEMLDVIAFARPIGTARTHHQVAYGQTILEILRELKVPLGSRLLIDVDGEYIPRSHWGAKRPRPGQVLRVGVMPMGGGGGQGQDRNKALRTTLLAVIAIAAIVITVATAGTGAPIAAGLTWGGLAGILAASAVTVGGAFDLDALRPC